MFCGFGFIMSDQKGTKLTTTTPKINSLPVSESHILICPSFEEVTIAHESLEKAESVKQYFLPS